MPKGHVAEHDATCRACGETFRTRKVGKAAFFCRRRECDQARGIVSPEERLARAAAREARARAVHQTKVSQLRTRLADVVARRRTAMEAALELGQAAEGLITELERMGEVVRAPAPRDAPAVASTNASTSASTVVALSADLDPLVSEILKRARALRWDHDTSPRHELRRAVTHVANAHGREALQHALLGLAAVSVNWARSLGVERPTRYQPQRTEDAA